MCRATLLTIAIVNLGVAALAEAEPLGYERFTSLDVDSGVFTMKTPAHVYSNYAKPLTLGVLSKNGVRDKRLIDIETHLDESGNLRLSGIWIENKGGHELDSWLVLDVQWSDLLLYFELGDEIIPLDIERYDNKKGKPRYAIIFQRNTHKARWLVKTDTGEDQIRGDMEGHKLEGPDGELELVKFRLVDVDRYFEWGNDNGQAIVKKESFDAILVENHGPSYVYFQWVTLPASSVTWVSGLPYSLGYYKMFGMQVVDTDSFVHYLLVDADRDFAIASQQSALEAELNQLLYGRAIDLEGGPTATPDYPHTNGSGPNNWETVFAGSLPN